MRIVLRLTAALSLTGVVAITIYALYAVSTEEAELRAAAERELRLLARSLQVAVENALRDNQELEIKVTSQPDAVWLDPFGSTDSQTARFYRLALR